MILFWLHKIIIDTLTIFTKLYLRVLYVWAMFFSDGEFNWRLSINREEILSLFKNLLTKTCLATGKNSSQTFLFLKIYSDIC